VAAAAVMRASHRAARVTAAPAAALRSLSREVPDIRPPTRSPSPKLHVGNPPQLLQSNEYHALRSRFDTPTQGKSQSPPASDQLDISPPLETESNAILPAATNFTSRETLQSTRRNPIVRKIGYAMSNNVSTYTGPPITGNSDIYVNL